VAASISNICAAPWWSAACQPKTAARLSEAELLEFLLLPSFSLRDTVTEISGRGVGLDVVADMLKQVRGTIRITTRRAGQPFPDAAAADAVGDPQPAGGDCR
jgi:hypothetical protein